MIDLNLLNENPIEVTMMYSDILSLKGKRKTTVPLMFPIDYYFEESNIHSEIEEPNLAAMLNQTIILYSSANGEYSVGLCANGDFRVYEVKNKSLYSVKGLPYFSSQSSHGVKSPNNIECVISNDGNLLLVKILQEISNPELRVEEDIWLWVHNNNTHSRENSTAIK